MLPSCQAEDGKWGQALLLPSDPRTEAVNSCLLPTPGLNWAARTQGPLSDTHRGIHVVHFLSDPPLILPTQLNLLLAVSFPLSCGGEGTAATE